MEPLINAGKLEEMPLTQKAEFIDQLFRSNKKLVLPREFGISIRTGERYRKLKNLVPELGCMVNKGKIPFLSGVAMGYLDQNEQEMVCKYIELLDVKLTRAAANELKNRRGKLSEREVYEIISGCRVGCAQESNMQIKLSEALYNKHFRGMSPEDISKKVDRVLAEWYRTHASEERMQLYHRLLKNCGNTCLCQIKV